MIKNNMNLPTLKEIETDLFRTLQETYSEAFNQLLTELDQMIAESRDKARFQLKDKRFMTMDSLFGSVEVKRNYYYDRESEKYVCLLDQHLQFEGAKGLSPLVQEMAMELAVEGLITELNSAVGTLGDERKESFLEDLINQYSQYPEALGDYSKWLFNHGVDTSDMCPMGASEATMHVFAKRVKNGRSWSDRGIDAFLSLMVALKDGLDIKTLVGTMTRMLEDLVENNPPKYYRESLKSSVGEATRNHIHYLQNASGKPMYDALRVLQGSFPS